MTEITHLAEHFIAKRKINTPRMDIQKKEDFSYNVIFL